MLLGHVQERLDSADSKSARARADGKQVEPRMERDRSNGLLVIERPAIVKVSA